MNSNEMSEALKKHVKECPECEVLNTTNTWFGGRQVFLCRTARDLRQKELKESL